MLKKLFAYTLVLTMVFSLFGGMTVTTADDVPGVVFEYDLSEENTYNSSLSIEKGGMVFDGTTSHVYSQNSAMGEAVSVGNFSKIVLTIGLDPEATAEASMEIYLMNNANNYASGSTIAAQGIKVEAGTGYKNYIYNYADMSKGSYNEVGNAVRQISLVNKSTNKVYVRSIKFVTDEWVEDTDEVFPDLNEKEEEPDEPTTGAGVVFEYDLSEENTYNSSLSIEKGGMVFDGTTSHVYSQNSAMGEAVSVGNFSKIVLTIGLDPEATAEASMEMYLMNNANNYASGSTIAAQIIKVEAGTGYKNYIYNYADMSKGSYNEVGNAVRQISLVNKSTNKVYVRSIKFVTDEWVEDTDEVFPDLNEKEEEPDEPTTGAGVVFEYDLSEENTYNTTLSIDKGGMVLLGGSGSHIYSSNSAMGEAVSVGNFSKIVLTLGLDSSVTENAGMEIYLMNVANNYASGSVIAAQAISVEAGTGYKNYIYNYADLSKGGYNKEGNAVRQISLVSKSKNNIYVRSIKFVTDEWVEDTDEVFPDFGEAPTTEAVYEFKLRTQNTYNTGANSNTTVAPIENFGMKLEGNRIWYSTQTASNGYGSNFITLDKFTKVAFTAKLDESVTENGYLTFYLNWVGLNNANEKMLVSGYVELEAGEGYKTYVCDLKEAIAACGMPTHPVRQMGINNNGNTMYIQSIKFVTDNWVEGEAELIDPEGPGNVVSSIPANNAINVSTDADLVLKLDEVPNLKTFTRLNVKINGSYDMVESIEGNDTLYNFVEYDVVNAPYEIKINLKPLTPGTRYVVELTDIGVGTSTVDYRTVFTTGFNAGTPTSTPLKHFDLSTENTYHPDGAPIENGGMHLTGNKIYYTPYNAAGGPVLFDFSKLDKVIFKAKLADGATSGAYLTFYFMQDGKNNANHTKVTSDYFWMDPTDDYQTYVVDLSDNVKSALETGTYTAVRQMGINNNGADMYVKDIKFVSAGYTDEACLYGGFEIVQNLGTETERNISKVGLPDEPGDITATLNYCYNLGDSDAVISLVTALYNGSKLEKIAVKSATLAPGACIEEPMYATLEDVPGGENYVVKSFLWKNYDPVTKPYVLTHAKKVLIIGNSITQHAPADFTSSYGVVWPNNWGMAVNSEKEDYAHLLMQKAENAGYMADIRIGGNIWRTEHSYGSIESKPEIYQTIADLEDSNAAELREFDPDIIIAACGANVSNVDSFITAYEFALDYIDADDNAKVITVGTICGSAPWAKVSELSAEKGWDYVDRTQAAGYAAYDYMAIPSYGSNAVGWHPGAKGMIAIADGVWEHLNGYLAE